MAQTRGAAGSSATSFLPSGSACQFRSFCPPTFNFTFSPFITVSHSPDRPGWLLWPVPPFPLPSHFHLSRPGLSLWQVPPYYLPLFTDFLPLSHPPTPLSLHTHAFTISTPSLLARLVIVAGPASLSAPSPLLSPPILTPLLVHSEARLVIVAGPALPFFLLP